ncbi:hypothetical protein PF006_g7074 [Phytophthora fragariae]|uniref:Uncharacterized protein n=1 Tax=Phytophthora fragariae TaxID=53985 RepID=A0A6A3IZG1_9STRA|nr:hypothetical protein PF003_g24390 [Phytophthora fragariae]KAE8986488.1 hypothetical protein PF011_g19961 [Phytophthora fragariae]KAE9148315.1 hypothetical protein PF006_g7074 [Phytophthora fragariae]
MIAKVLSGYKPKAAIPLQDLSSFDSQTLESIDEVQRNLFAACYQLETEIYNVNKKVIDVLTAGVVRHYPLLKSLSPRSPAVKRIETCVTHAGHSLADLLAWPTHLAKAPVSCKDIAQDDKPQVHRDPKPRETSYEQKVIDHQAAVIEHFIENSNRQEARMDRFEAKMNGNPVPPTRKRAKGDEDADDFSKPKKKQRRGSATDLHATWFTWYAQESVGK